MGMEIFDIRESGSNALLKYALQHKVNPLKNQNFKNIINEEFHYFVTMGPVSFIELFQLLQVYRENPTIRIMENNVIDVPPSMELKAYGAIGNQVKESCEKAIALSQQMFPNIPYEVATLYIPIACRSFNIRIPITFSDMIHSIDADEYVKVFNDTYPHPDNFDILKKSKSLMNAIGRMIAQHEPVVVHARYHRLLPVVGGFFIDDTGQGHHLIVRQLHFLSLVCAVEVPELLVFLLHPFHELVQRHIPIHVIRVGDEEAEDGCSVVAPLLAVGLVFQRLCNRRAVQHQLL